jgi:hypothetical protein
LVELFGIQQLPLLVLKGAALSSLLYPEPGLRPFGDLDLLVRRNDVPAAVNLLQREGYIRADERHEGFSEQFLKSLNLTSSRALGPSLDLHWHLFAPVYFRLRTPIEFFWNLPLAFQVAGRPAFTLGPMPQLVHLCAHAGLHTHPPLIWLFDIARWLEKFRSDIDWQEFVSVVRKRELAPAVSRVLRDAARWWNANVPDETLAALDKTRTSAQARMVYSAYSSPDGGARGVVDMMYQDGMGNKLKYAAQLLVPSQEYITSGKRTRSAPVPMLYARRVWGISRYVIGSVWTMMTRSLSNR